jgi:hypothetical protein
MIGLHFTGDNARCGEASPACRGVSTFRGRGGSYFNQRSFLGFCVLALYQGTTLVGPQKE